MILVLLLIFSLIFNRPILASDNVFGLHLSQTEDIHKTSSIINSQNGDWGWVTLVIKNDQLDKNTWQGFFDNCRKYHIIPIIRIATIGEKDYWKRPQYSEIDHLLLAGGGAQIPGLSKLLQDNLGYRVTLANPFLRMGYAPQVDAKKIERNASSLLVACGLALRSFD